jgi:hypothetical protein
MRASIVIPPRCATVFAKLSDCPPMPLFKPIIVTRMSVIASTAPTATVRENLPVE